MDRRWIFPLITALIVLLSGCDNLPYTVAPQTIDIPTLPNPDLVEPETIDVPTLPTAQSYSRRRS